MVWDSEESRLQCLPVLALGSGSHPSNKTAANNHLGGSLKRGYRGNMRLYKAQGFGIQV